MLVVFFKRSTKKKALINANNKPVFVQSVKVYSMCSFMIINIIGVFVLYSSRLCINLLLFTLPT